MTEGVTLRAGVIGAGIMGLNHARQLAAIAGFDLVGVAEPNAERRAKVAGELGRPGFATASELLAEKPDLVVVAAPSVHHKEAALEAFAAGAHVLVEKPLAPTVADARAIVDAARAAGRKLMVGHVERFNPAVQAAARALGEETPLAIAITRVSLFPARISDVGVVLDIGVHDIDLVRMLGGDIVAAHAALARGKGLAVEDSAAMQFKTERGAIAQVMTSWIAPFRQRSLSILTPTRRIDADLLTKTAIEYSNVQPDGAYTARPLFVANVDALRAELAAFADAIRADAEPPVSGQDGLRALEVALECLK